MRLGSTSLASTYLDATSLDAASHAAQTPTLHPFADPVPIRHTGDSQYLGHGVNWRVTHEPIDVVMASRWLLHHVARDRALDHIYGRSNRP